VVEGSKVVRMHSDWSPLEFVSETRVLPHTIAVPSGGGVRLGVRVRSADGPPLSFSSRSAAKRPPAYLSKVEEGGGLVLGRICTSWMSTLGRLRWAYHLCSMVMFAGALLQEVRAAAVQVPGGEGLKEERR